ncbi:hypothetical protein PG990_001709 [Apiospora arundinis]
MAPDALGDANRKFWDERAGALFQEDWVKVLSKQLRDCLVSSVEFMGIRKSSPGGPSTKLIDYACGNGVVSHALFDNFDVIRGVDISDGMGNLLDPATPLDDPDLYDADAIIMSMALHHTGDPQKIMAKMAERVRSGGVVVAIDWVTSDSDGAHKHSAAHGHHTTSKHSFNSEEMSELFAGAGCDKESFGFRTYHETSHIPEHITNTKGVLTGLSSSPRRTSCERMEMGIGSK